MSKNIAFELLIAEADRSYRRWYIALQCWTLSIIPAGWALPLRVMMPVTVVWVVGVWVLQKRWRKAAAYGWKLRTDNLEQLVAECLALKHELYACSYLCFACADETDRIMNDDEWWAKNGPKEP